VETLTFEPRPFILRRVIRSPNVFTMECGRYLPQLCHTHSHNGQWTSNNALTTRDAAHCLYSTHKEGGGPRFLPLAPCRRVDFLTGPREHESRRKGVRGSRIAEDRSIRVLILLTQFQSLYHNQIISYNNKSGRRGNDPAEFPVRQLKEPQGTLPEAAARLTRTFDPCCHGR